MTDATEAANIAATLLNAGQNANEVISALYEAFETYRFYETNGRLYMEDDDGRFPATMLLHIPETGLTLKEQDKCR